LLVPVEYADLISAELAGEEATATEFRQRSVAVVSLSGTLVALLSGLLAIAAGSKEEFLPGSAHGPLLTAMVLFVLAGVAALVVNIPLNQERASADELRRLVTQQWGDAPDNAARAVAEVRVTTLKSMRGQNQFRSWFLLVAIALEIGAVGATGLTAVRIADSVL
jgi:hypothetical protein